MNAAPATLRPDRGASPTGTARGGRRHIPRADACARLADSPDLAAAALFIALEAAVLAHARATLPDVLADIGIVPAPDRRFRT